MKKISVIVIALLLVSCTANKNNSFKDIFGLHEISFVCNEESYIFYADTNSFLIIDGIYSGVRVLFTGSSCDVLYNDFSISTCPNVFPQLFTFLKLYNAASLGISLVETNEPFVKALLIDSCRFLVYYNQDNFSIDRIVAETENGSFVYRFSVSEDKIE